MSLTSYAAVYLQLDLAMIPGHKIRSPYGLTRRTP